MYDLKSGSKAMNGWNIWIKNQYQKQTQGKSTDLSLLKKKEK